MGMTRKLFDFLVLDTRLAGAAIERRIMPGWAAAHVKRECLPLANRPRTNFGIHLSSRILDRRMAACRGDQRRSGVRIGNSLFTHGQIAFSTYLC
jgi:hypothetical protein